MGKESGPIDEMEMPKESVEINEDDKNSLEVKPNDDGTYELTIRMATLEKDGKGTKVKYDNWSKSFPDMESAIKAYGKAYELGLGNSTSYYEPREKNQEWSAFNEFADSLDVSPRQMEK